MATHPRGQKYILSASISHEVGKVLDERNKEHGVIKSFEVEQALRQYYGLKNLRSSRLETPASSAVVPEAATPTIPTTTAIIDITATGSSIPEADSLIDTATRGVNSRRTTTATTA